MEADMANDLKSSEGFKIYEEGKHRRYQLLFGVNGGAFAVAKLFTEPNAASLLGDLTLGQLAIGMIVFTVAMTVDIFMFGEKMRKLGETTYNPYLKDAFGDVGKTVLLAIGFLISAGWFLVI
jgi:hypothetical protein